MTLIHRLRKYDAWNPVHATAGTFRGFGLGWGCGIGWGPGFGPQLVGFVGAGCGVGVCVGLTLVGVGVGQDLPALGLAALPWNTLQYTTREGLSRRKSAVRALLRARDRLLSCRNTAPAPPTFPALASPAASSLAPSAAPSRPDPHRSAALLHSLRRGIAGAAEAGEGALLHLGRAVRAPRWGALGVPRAGRAVFTSPVPRALPAAALAVEGGPAAGRTLVPLNWGSEARRYTALVARVASCEATAASWWSMRVALYRMLVMRLGKVS